MLTGAALATINRLPVLLLPADTFATRVSSPVLQELELPSSGDVTVNDAFKPLSRYFDRVWRPEQLPAALLGAIGSVQTLFGNSVLLLAIGGGLAALALRRGRQREAGIVMLIGFAAALSLLPYWAPLHHLREWDIVVRTPTSVGDHYGFLNRNLSASSGWGGMVWPGMVLAALVLSGAGQFKRNPLIRAEADRDVLLFSGLALAAGVAGTFCFLETSG